MENKGFDKYRFRKYDPEYRQRFLIEKKRLIKLFPKSKIEHIGSTAVPDLGGKGIIDINLGAKKKDVLPMMRRLNENRYIHIEKAGDGKERWFFRKDYRYRGNVRRVHVHLTLEDSDTWKNCIYFREHLRKNKISLKEYASLKKEAVMLGMKDDEYRDHKKKFIEHIIKNRKKE